MNASFLKTGMIICSCLTFLFASGNLEAAKKKKSKASPKKQTPKTFVAFMERVSPSIVGIEVTNQDPNIGHFAACKDYFWTLCGYESVLDQNPNRCSGFFISSNGYIVTSATHFDDPYNIVVTLNDGRELGATLLGTDPQTNIAVLKVEGSSFPFLKLNKSQVRRYDRIFAFGSPYFIENQRSAGNITTLAEASLQNQYQTNVRINPAAEGGPLVDIQGEVIGLNQVLSDEEDARIGSATPASVIKAVFDEIISKNETVDETAS